MKLCEKNEENRGRYGIIFKSQYEYFHNVLRKIGVFHVLRGYCTTNQKKNEMVCALSQY